MTKEWFECRICYSTGNVGYIATKDNQRLCPYCIERYGYSMTTIMNSKFDELDFPDRDLSHSAKEDRNPDRYFLCGSTGNTDHISTEDDRRFCQECVKRSGLLTKTEDNSPSNEEIQSDSPPPGMDIRAILYLILTAKGSPIIQEYMDNCGRDVVSGFFLEVYKATKRCDNCQMMTLESLLVDCKADLFFDKEEVNEKRRFIEEAWKAANEDLAWADNTELGNSSHQRIGERSFFKRSICEHICDKCGMLIPQGDGFYRRTIIYPAIRHEKCNNAIRYAYEYSFVEHIVSYTESIQEILLRQGYSLPFIPEKLVRMLIRQGYEIKEDSITALPNMGDFIMDYLSGVDDFTLVRRYIPYLSYLICFLHMRDIPLKRIGEIGSDILFLRCDDGKHQETKDILNSTGYVDIHCGNYGEAAIEREIKNMMARVILSFIFNRYGLSDTETEMVVVGGEAKSYSFGEDNGDADIRITVESDGTIMCSDRVSCKDFCTYFGLDDSSSANILRYLVSITG